MVTTHYSPMLPRHHRLSLHTELNRIKKEGKLFQGRLFSLLVTPSLSAISYQPSAIKPSRFAFIVSTKVHKKAVKRNRAKRLLSEAVYQLLPRIKPGFGVVFLVKKGVIDKSFEEVRAEVERMFGRVGITEQLNNVTI